jgi:hypothetical protein
MRDAQRALESRAHTQSTGETRRGVNVWSRVRTRLKTSRGRHCPLWHLWFAHKHLATKLDPLQSRNSHPTMHLSLLPLGPQHRDDTRPFLRSTTLLVLFRTSIYPLDCDPGPASTASEAVLNCHGPPNGHLRQPFDRSTRKAAQMG